MRQKERILKSGFFAEPDLEGYLNSIRAEQTDVDRCAALVNAESQYTALRKSLCM
jgi:hypothetical protein